MSVKATIVAASVSLGVLIVGFGTILVSEHGEIRADIRQIQTTLTEIGQRVSHIEGRLAIPLESGAPEDGAQE